MRISLTIGVLIGSFFLAFQAGATHNRAGEITYRHIADLTYEITVTTCTKTSAPADRPTLEIDYGDRTGLDSIDRDSIINVYGDAQVNYYTTKHTYKGPGSYTISVEDPNRNANVVNIQGSVNRSFCIQTELFISPFAEGHNNSVRFKEGACNELACVDEIYCHNVSAYDPDGDSLHYSLVTPRGMDCEPIPVYDRPDKCGLCSPGPNNDLEIDPATGELCWDAPQVAGEYNIAIKVKEYRNGILVGSVVRDMQITATGQCNNEAPELDPLPDTCVKAGTDIEFQVSATDPDNDEITLKGSGGPFEVAQSPAQFPHGITNPGNVSGTFKWSTKCAHVRKRPYQATFRVRDDKQVALQDFETMNIRVVAPAPQNPQASPAGNTMELEWEKSICTQATSYKIYRREDSIGFSPDHCETGVPDYTGYTLLDSTMGLNDTSYVDDNGLTHGTRYCYMVVASFPDGAESYASVEFCGRLIKDVPVITHASVGRTDTDNGVDTIRWSMPTEIDTTDRFPGPYHYRILRGDGLSGEQQVIGTTSSDSSLPRVDTTFVDKGLDSKNRANNYVIELYSDTTLVGRTNPGATPFLTLTPDDQELELELETNVPWTNDSFVVYRLHPDSAQYDSIALTTEPSYTDTGLVNGKQYCYFMKTKGRYTAPGFAEPLINFSQKTCDRPEDRTPPCPPVLSLTPDCPNINNELTWTDPNNTCANDVDHYRIHYRPTDSGAMEVIEVNSPHTDTLLDHDNNGSIAGCYAVTAVDSVGNESEKSNIECADNCPAFEMPNVFTPNGDGNNDLLEPIVHKFVDSLHIKIFNRWGQIVHETNEPNINWDGTHMESGKLVPAGVYYYIVHVEFIRLKGSEISRSQGSVQLLRSADDGNERDP